MKKPFYLLSGMSMKKEIHSGEGQSYYERGIARFFLQDYEGSIADLFKVIEIDPKNKWCYLYIGIAKMGIADFPGAISDFSRAIDLNPMFTAAYYNKGLLKIGLGHVHSGLLELNKANKLNGTILYKGININCN